MTLDVENCDRQTDRQTDQPTKLGTEASSPELKNKNTQMHVGIHIISYLLLDHLIQEYVLRDRNGNILGAKALKRNQKRYSCEPTTAKEKGDIKQMIFRATA